MKELEGGLLSSRQRHNGKAKTCYVVCTTYSIHVGLDRMAVGDGDDDDDDDDDDSEVCQFPCLCIPSMDKMDIDILCCLQKQILFWKSQQKFLFFYPRER